MKHKLLVVGLIAMSSHALASNEFEHFANVVCKDVKPFSECYNGMKDLANGAFNLGKMQALCDMAGDIEQCKVLKSGDFKQSLDWLGVSNEKQAYER